MPKKPKRDILIYTMLSIMIAGVILKAIMVASVDRDLYLSLFTCVLLGATIIVMQIRTENLIFENKRLSEQLYESKVSKCIEEGEDEHI